MAKLDYESAAARRALAGEYREHLEQIKAERRKNLTPEQHKEVKLLSRCDARSVLYDTLETALTAGRTPSSVLRGELSWLFGTVIPASHLDMLCTVADSVRERPYNTSYTRRSFRSTSYATYTDCIWRMLYHYVTGYNDLHLAEFPLSDILSHTLPPAARAYLDSYDWYEGYSTGEIAYALDNHDAAVEEAIRRALCEQNAGTTRVTWPLLRGIFMSHRPDFHALVCDLLVAARLQEGLRQAICENADLGTKEAFLAVLATIEREGLIRFSSVKRAVGTWLGLITEDSGDLERVSDKSVRLICECLRSPEARDAYLASEDAVAIHIALWSIALNSVEDASAAVRRIAAEGTHHQLLVAGYFAEQIGDAHMSHELAAAILRDKTEVDDLLAVWLPRFLPDRCGRIPRDGAAPHGKPLWRDWFSSLDEVRAYYTRMDALRRSIAGKGKTYSPCIFPWHTATVQKSDLSEVVCLLAILSGENDLRDAACALIKDCSADRRASYFERLCLNPRTDIQRRALLEGICDKETFTRSAAARRVATLTLTADEYRLVESYLRFKSADIRTVTESLLLRQDDDTLLTCIDRLLSDTKEDIRYGALDMLTELQKDEARQGIIKALIPRLAARLTEEKVPEKERILLEALVPAATEEAPAEAPLYSEADRYIPTAFDEAYTAAVADTFAAYFPDGHLRERLTGKKSLLQSVKSVLKALSDKDKCPTATQAAADIDAIARLYDAHQNDPCSESVRELEGVALIGQIRYSFRCNIGSDGTPHIPGSEIWDTAVSELGMTPTRLFRAHLRLLSLAVHRKMRTVTRPLVADLFGAGFETAEPPTEAERVLEILQYLTLRYPLPGPDRVAMSAAVGLWFLTSVADADVLLHCPDDSDSRPRPMQMAHLLGHPQFGQLLAPLQCRPGADTAHLFPITVAVTERCIAATRALPEVDRAELVGHHSWVYENRFEHLLSNKRLYFFGDNEYRYVTVEAYTLAVHEKLISEEAFLEYAFRPYVLRSALEFLTDITADRFGVAEGAAARHDYIYGSGRVRIDSTISRFVGHKGDLTEADNALLDTAVRLLARLLPVVLSAEYRRGDSPTAYSYAIPAIHRVVGCEHLAAILRALGSDTLSPQGYWYGYSSYEAAAPSRGNALTHLLSVCLPRAGETVEDLKNALSGKGITEKRLIEAALYAPSWIPLIGRCLGVPGFESACYYFIAHMNERFDDRRLAVIARYTPLSSDELNLGAFDRDWFLSAHASVGDALFETIYTAAKYISEGARHARARKYADATLGKLAINETEKAISDKRNKDLLMAYALIPLTGEDDLLRRYLFIESFRRESRKYGSQRMAGEGKAADMALRNLASAAGYSDTMRLTLRMETKVLDDSRALLEPQDVDGVLLHLTLGDDGKADLTVQKDGKTLKSIPSKLKKHPTVVALGELKKTLTEQYRRTRKMLEEAMETGVIFTMAEITALAAHPVVYPMLEKLVLTTGNLPLSEAAAKAAAQPGDTAEPAANQPADTVKAAPAETLSANATPAVFGFPTAGGLLDASGTLTPLAADTPVRIAHPYDLHTAGVWRDYQGYLFANRIAQPYRQVFRELYLMTDDERDAYHSLRYAGHQLQPQKTVATLKSRRWVADVEDGLQKVYYRENVIARMYALADWFSPADIESPTLEWVVFADRRTGEELKMEAIPPILFSEVMRDVDLAVSVAHAGGVDPEASRSTVEMRAAILELLLPLFGHTNVRIEHNHAFITGRLADYNVNLGSGVVHEVGGVMIPVLPVHSQHRGRVFLPFVDDDPKTAEVLSKVLLFAEDETIKDPSILQWIKK